MLDTERETFERIMYALVKNAARSSWVEFMEDWDFSDDDYQSFKDNLAQELGLDPAKFYL